MVNEWFSVQLELSTHKNILWVSLVPCVGKMAERIIGPPLS